MKTKEARSKITFKCRSHNQRGMKIATLTVMAGLDALHRIKLLNQSEVALAKNRPAE